MTTGRAMHTIYAVFQRFRDVDLAQLIGAVGVYVIWDATAKASPTYIGEGTILKRFNDHVRRDGRRFTHPWNGYVAVVSGSTRGVHKSESLAIERLLLDVARDTDREPINSHPGAASVVRRLCRNDMLRVAVRGYDPLLPPEEGRPFVGAKEIRVCMDEADNLFVTHGWRTRRRRKAFLTN